MERPRVLVVDDDEQITEFLRRALAYTGFAADIADSGEAGLERALVQPPDVVILDILMPGLDGFEVCQRLRAGDDVPILMLTARDETADKVRGLECGADDYVVKPFVVDELVARVRALLRRRAPERPNQAHLADLTADLGTRQVWRGDRPVQLTCREFELLTAFLRQPRHVLTRNQLLEQVWGFDSDADTHVLEVYVRSLREKLEANREPRLIYTLRGAGYVLREPEIGCP